MRCRIFAGMNVRTNLERLIAERDTNATALAEATGVPQPTIHRILTGETADPRTKTLEPLARYFGVSVSDLRHKDFSSGVREAAPTYGNVEEGPRIRGMVPLISWVKAGALCEAIDNLAPGDAEEWLPCPFPHSKSSFCLRLVGNSMEPEYREGEVILVDPEVEAKHGSDVVVHTPDGKTTFKRYQQSEDGSYLLALNPAFPDRIIKVPAETRICGVVTASWMNRRR